MFIYAWCRIGLNAGFFWVSLLRATSVWCRVLVHTESECLLWPSMSTTHYYRYFVYTIIFIINNSLNTKNYYTTLIHIRETHCVGLGASTITIQNASIYEEFCWRFKSASQSEGLESFVCLFKFPSLAPPPHMWPSHPSVLSCHTILIPCWLEIVSLYCV